jgi:hypothetical protein
VVDEVKVKDEYARANLDYDMVMKWANETASSRRLRYFDHGDRKYVTDGVLIVESVPDLLREPRLRAIDDPNPEPAVKIIRQVLNSRKLPAIWVNDTPEARSVDRRIVMVREKNNIIPCAFDAQFCSILTPEPPIAAVRPPKLAWHKPHHYPIIGGNDLIRWLLMPLFLHQYERDEILRMYPAVEVGTD